MAQKYVNVGSEITFFEEPVSRVPNQRVHPIRDTRELHEEIGGDVRPAHVGQFVPQHVPQALDGPPRGNRRQEGPTAPAPTLHTIAAPKKNTSHRAGISRTDQRVHPVHGCSPHFIANFLPCVPGGVNPRVSRASITRVGE